MADLIVTFEPVDGGRSSVGKTDENGEYTLQYNTDVSGALVGEHKVRITSPSEAPDPSGEQDDQIPPHYNTNTEIIKEVKSGSNTIDIKLHM